MTKLRIVTATAMLLALGTAANAQNLNMDGVAAGSNDGRPAAGMSQASVQSRYGSPVSVQAPVGEPPITRWVYADFIVYFEYDKVIHSVLKR